MGAIHSSQHTAPDATHSSTRCCPTHEMWELPTPLIVANRSQQGEEVRELPARPQQHPGTLRANIQGTAYTDLSSRDKCVYATDAMINTETYTLRKAYTATSIITHAQSKAGLNTYPNKLGRNANRLHKEMSSHTSPASSKRPKAAPNEACQQKESNATTLTSIGAIYRRQSEKIRAFKIATLLATRAWLRPVSRGNRHFTIDCGRLRQSGPRPETGFLRQPALEGPTRSARTDSPRQDWPETIFRRREAAAAAAHEGGGRGGLWRGEGGGGLDD
ncbi:hypothetical protein F511_40202 [Dorcoceras hygrometricum]|uniref:Uncharacterized protein n=1 Tax=Dorcoceras hygrometricum TaxID=472368 RepID=A0A2Z7AGL8_9LAMI|nr:hypothetical protein F511_40202 [Dorcoceras hygrometricum]